MRNGTANRIVKNTHTIGVAVAFLAAFPVLFRVTTAEAKQTNFGARTNDYTGSDCNTSVQVESCPGAGSGCFCSINFEGSVSGAVGSGYGQTYINSDVDVTKQCHLFNGTTFAVGARDVEQIDFQGSICEDQDRVSVRGDYHIERSAGGKTGNGKVSGGVMNNRTMILHFTESR